jgi:lactate permease
MVAPVQQALQSVTFEVSDVLGTGIGGSFPPLYSPGAAFLVAAAVTVLIQGVDRDELRTALSRTGTAVVGTGIALAAAVPLVRVFVNSGENGAGLTSMPLELAAAGADALGSAWPLAAPVVGALGSFVSGSATFSHLMFAQLQSDVATSIGADPTVVLGQQVGGANGGNLVAAVNVVAVAGVTRQLGREGDIIVRTAVPMAVYLLGFALVGTLLLALAA